MDGPLDLGSAGTVETIGPSLYVGLLGDGNVKLDKMNPLEREDDGGHSDMVDQSPG